MEGAFMKSEGKFFRNSIRLVLINIIVILIFSSSVLGKDVGETFETGMRVKVNKLYTGTFEKKGDKDFYIFTPKENQKYKVQVIDKSGRNMEKLGYEDGIIVTSQQRVLFLYPQENGSKWGGTGTMHYGFTPETKGEKYLPYEILDLGKYSIKPNSKYDIFIDKFGDVALTFIGDYKGKYQFKIIGKNGKAETVEAKSSSSSSSKKAKYTIKYKLNGGKNHKDNPKQFNSSTNTFSLKDPTRIGYTFKGWYKDKKFTKSIKQIKKGTKGNITVYAKWVKNRTFKYGRDNNSFHHSTNPKLSGFDRNENVIDDEYWPIIEATFGKFYKNRLKEKLDNAIKKGGGLEGGVCFGIAAAVGLVYDGYLTPTDLSDDGEAKSFYELKAPKKNRKLANFINILQATITRYPKKLNRQFVVKNVEKICKTIVKYAKNTAMNNKSVILAFTYSEGLGSIGHALLIVGYEYDYNKKQHIIELFDPNETLVSGTKERKVKNQKSLHMYISDDYKSFKTDGNDKSLAGKLKYSNVAQYTLNNKLYSISLVTIEDIWNKALPIHKFFSVYTG